ncbi:hypothetical protein BKA93DRAFT_312245 [Sparassis latifolia]
MALPLKSMDFLVTRHDVANDKPCYIDKLSNDILVDEVFKYLDAFDILRLRQVSRLYYYLTHHSAIWKRLLRTIDVPIPPFPPSANYSLEKLTGFEVERAVVRAVSLERDWKKEKPAYRMWWSFCAHHEVLSMVMLPGGRYLIASVSDKKRTRYSIVLFAMDSVLAGAFALAKTNTITEAYNLQARYMTIQGERGIVISYVRKRCKKRTKKSASSSEHGVDKEEPPIKYHECISLHVQLSSLDILVDSRLEPGSEEFIEFAKAQPPPFQMLAMVRASASLGVPSLDNIFGSPYLAIPQGNNKIVFKNLNGGAGSTLNCGPTAVAPIEKHTILAIRLVPAGNKILVARRICPDNAEPLLSVEYFNVIISGKVSTEVHQFNTDQMFSFDANAEIAQISDHGIPPREDDSVMGDLYDCPEVCTPRPISVYFTLKSGPILLRLTLFPKRKTDAPPASSPKGFPTSPTSPTQTLSHARTYGAYKYPLPELRILSYLSWDCHGMEVRVLPGSYRAIAYLVKKGKDGDVPSVSHCFRYYDPASRSADAAANVDELDAAAVEAVVNGLQPPKREIVKQFRIPRRALKSVRALAWDENIGRLCIASGDGTCIQVFDFAHASTVEHTDEGIERWPVPVHLDPNPDAILTPRPMLPTKTGLGE